MLESIKRDAEEVERIAGKPAFLTARALDDSGAGAIWLAGALMALCPVSGKNARLTCQAFSDISSGFRYYGQKMLTTGDTSAAQALIMSTVDYHAKTIVDNRENAQSVCETIHKAFGKIINHRGGWKLCAALDTYSIFWDVETLLAIGAARNARGAETLKKLKEEQEAERAAFEEAELRRLFGEDR